MGNSKRAANGAGPQVVIALTVIHRPGQDGEVQLHSEYDRARTVALIRAIADRYEAAGQQPAATPTGEDTPE